MEPEGFLRRLFPLSLPSPSRAPDGPCWGAWEGETRFADRPSSRIDTGKASGIVVVSFRYRFDTTMPEKLVQVHVRLTEEQRKWLTKRAELKTCSISQVVRNLIVDRQFVEEIPAAIQSELLKQGCPDGLLSH